MPLPAEEINAGPVGGSMVLTMSKGRTDRIRINGHPTRTITVTPLGGALRHWTVDNAGAQGAGADVASGSSFTVVAADGSREAVMVGAGDSITVRAVFT